MVTGFSGKVAIEEDDMKARKKVTPAPAPAADYRESPVCVRIPEDLRRAVEKEAKARFMTRSAFINWVLDRAVRKKPLRFD